MLNIRYLNDLIAKRKEKEDGDFKELVKNLSEMGINIFSNESESEIKRIDILLSELEQKWKEKTQ